MQIPASAWTGSLPRIGATPSPQGLTADKAAQPVTAPSFSETLKNLNHTQSESFAAGNDLVTGNAQSLHQVVSQVEESSLALNLAVSVRNKAIEAYQEIMKIQV